MLPRPEEQNPLHSLGCAQGQQQETGGSLMSCFGHLHGTMQVGILDQSTRAAHWSDSHTGLGTQ